MARDRFGKRFNNSTTSFAYTPGIGCLLRNPDGLKWKWKRNPNTPTQTIGSQQANSLTQRKKKGLGVPSMPHFSFEEPKPRAPQLAHEPGKVDWLAIAEALIPDSKAEKIIMDQNGAIILAMRKGRKAFTACLSTKTGLLQWTEGYEEYIPPRNGAQFSRRGHSAGSRKKQQ